MTIDELKDIIFLVACESLPGVHDGALLDMSISAAKAIKYNETLSETP
jgi:hypothetical protein